MSGFHPEEEGSMSLMRLHLSAVVAQSVVHYIGNVEVVGSIPINSTTK